MESKKNLYTGLLFTAIVALVIGLHIYVFPLFYKSSKPAPPPPINQVVYFETTIEVLYNDGYTDTVNVRVYDRPDNFELVKGDLSYWKPTGQTGGAVAGKTTIGSFVLTYKVLSSIIKQYP